MALKPTTKSSVPKMVFRCSTCSAVYPRWQGKCTSCGSWDTLVEERAPSASGATFGGTATARSAASVHRLSDVDDAHTARIPSGMAAFDEVLGGGIVPGSLILLGGDPGVGKSTLALEIASILKVKTLYVTGEESLHQLKIRATRLGTGDNLYALAETQLNSVLDAVASTQPAVVVIDSIQTMYADVATGVAGSVSQVSFITQVIMRLAKEANVTFVLIGHVTKEGFLAGPKTLEHMVDTVLYLEGERFTSFRILRAVKNRFGTSNEVAIFEMTGRGIHPVANPSEMFLQEGDREAPGNVVTAVIEGSRALLLEIQSLTSKTTVSYPKRTASGFDFNRLQLIAAIISKRLNLTLSTFDIYVNVVGGMKISDPSADLAVALAIVSSVKDLSLKGTVAIGELGLSGEIRTVPNLEKRVREAEKLGFKKVLVPSGTKVTSTKTEIVKAKNLTDAVRLLS
jgi:DNA repair protein RadA/Sms